MMVSLTGPLIAIASLEQMLLANKVDSVSWLDSTGKMLVLTTGILGLGSAVWDIVRPRESSEVDDSV